MNIKQCEASGKSDHNHFGKPTLNEDTLEFQVTCIIYSEENESHIFLYSTVHSKKGDLFFIS